MEKRLLAAEEKAKLINMAVDSGFRVIEVGSFVSPKVIPQMSNIAEAIALVEHIPGVSYRALVTNLKGVQRAIECGIKKVKLTVSASHSHNLSNFNCTPKETVAGFKECKELADTNGIEVSAAIATSFGCPFEGKIPIEQVDSVVTSFLELGISEMSLSDTTGVAHPSQVYDYCSHFGKKYPNVAWNLHFHNTRGMALANVLAGMQAGVIRFDSAFAGLGGCPFAPGASGNVASEDLLHMLCEMGIETGIDLDKAIQTGKFVQSILGHADSTVLKAGKTSDLIPSAPKEQTTGVFR